VKAPFQDVEVPFQYVVVPFQGVEASYVEVVPFPYQDEKVE
jgi:hypothetical protein